MASPGNLIYVHVFLLNFQAGQAGDKLGLNWVRAGQPASAGSLSELVVDLLFQNLAWANQTMSSWEQPSQPSAIPWALQWRPGNCRWTARGLCDELILLNPWWGVISRAEMTTRYVSRELFMSAASATACRWLWMELRSATTQRANEPPYNLHPA